MVEGVLTVNLKAKLKKAPNWRRSDSATKILKTILKRKTGAKKVKIGSSLNQFIWKNGMKSPPSKIKVKLTESDRFVTAELMA